MKHLHTYNNKLRNVNNCVDSICRHSLFSGVVSYVIKDATFEEIGQTRGSSAAAIQFSFQGGNEVCFFNIDPIFVRKFLILDSKSVTNFGPWSYKYGKA